MLPFQLKELSNGNQAGAALLHLRLFHDFSMG